MPFACHWKPSEIVGLHRRSSSNNVLNFQTVILKCTVFSKTCDPLGKSKIRWAVLVQTIQNDDPPLYINTKTQKHSLQRRERWLGSAGWRGEEEEGGRRNVSSETRGRRLPETTKRPTRGRRLPEKMKKSVVLSRNKNVPLADHLREKKVVS